MNISNYDFIWSCYTATDIESIISDVRRKKTKFLYVLDTYDVVENFLPYTEAELFGGSDRNQLAQKFICYDFLFSDLDSNQIVLPNEYKVELLAAKNKLHKHLREAKAVISNIRKLRQQTPDFSNHEIMRDFFKKHFEIILLLLIINNKRTSVLDDFRAFVRDRLATDEINTNHKTDPIVNEILVTTKPSALSVELFKAFVNDQRLFLASIEQENSRHVYLENTFRDIQVVERVININRKLAERNLGVFVIYLSTANKTRFIFDLVKKHFLAFDQELNFEIDFHRNIFQYFLYNKISLEFKDDFEKQEEILIALKYAREAIGDAKDTTKNLKGSQTVALIRQMFEDASSSIDNHFFLTIYRKYKNIFSRMTVNTIDGNLDPGEVRRILLEIDNNIESIEQSVINMDMSLHLVNQSLEVMNLLNGLERRVSSDIIRNPYQHLPLLLFIGGGLVPELKEKIFHFINLISETEKPGENANSSLLRTSLQQVLLILGNAVSHREKIVRLIVISYIRMFCGKKIQDEKSLISDFEGYLEILKAVNTSIDVDKSEASGVMQYTTKEQPLSVEICYVLIWLYRRNDRVDDGIEMATGLLSVDPNDARIWHGLGLCHLVTAYKQMNGDDTTKAKLKFDLAHQCLSRCSELLTPLYSSLGGNLTAEGYLLMKSETALLNSMININIRRYELSGLTEFSYISQGLDILPQIKLLFVRMHLNYEQHATYLGTEVELWYHQALYFKGQSDILAAREAVLKASLALKTLTGLPDYKYSDEFFKDRFRRVPSLMFDLMSLR